MKKAQIQKQEQQHQYSATTQVQMIINQETTIQVIHHEQSQVKELVLLSETTDADPEIPFS